MTGIKKKEFYPDWLSIFHNPSFISRLRLLQGIKKHAHELNGRLLDFGCGEKPYLALFSVDEYLGLDIEKSGHTHKNSNVDAYYDGKIIPFDSEYFDSFFSSEVFEHVFNLPIILKEINRVVKSGGKLLITVPFAIHEHEEPFDFARYTTFGIKKILNENGFEILSIDKTNHYVEVIFQSMAWYVTSFFIKRFRGLTLIQLLIFVAPINILGMIFSKILPKVNSNYNNIVILAQKRECI
ncbi:MAG: class I SAM-dependent methyltransferase [Cyclobacteriaceae bacterium]|nr:class I SAM-dependent methyltransferase [Cyclobacteriaceae bacterium]